LAVSAIDLIASWGRVGDDESVEISFFEGVFFDHPSGHKFKQDTPVFFAQL